MILSENTEVEKYDIFHVDFCPQWEHWSRKVWHFPCGFPCGFEESPQLMYCNINLRESTCYYSGFLRTSLHPASWDKAHSHFPPFPTSDYTIRSLGPSPSLLSLERVYISLSCFAHKCLDGALGATVNPKAIIYLCTESVRPGGLGVLRQLDSWWFATTISQAFPEEV